MTRRSYSWNAYESDLASGVDATGNTIIVTSAAGLTAPCYLVIEPENDSLREYVKVTAIAVNTLTADRGLDGSANAGQAHNAGVKIRAIAVHQWLNDIFDDIIDVDTRVTDHEGAGDPHPQYQTEAESDTRYVNVTGDTMAGPLLLTGDPAVDDESSRKAYVDAGDAADQQYTDDELADHDGADTSHGLKSNANPHNHDRYLDAEAADVADAQIALHAADPAAHHDKYTDAEAVTAMGLVDDTNDLNHVRYTDAEAVAAVEGGAAIVGLADGGDHHFTGGTPGSEGKSLIGGVNVSMPDGWNSCKVVASCSIQYAGASGNWQSIGHITIDGNAGSQSAGPVVPTGGDPHLHVAHVRNSSEGTIDIDVYFGSNEPAVTATARTSIIIYSLFRLT